MMLGCPHCGTWLHEECIIDDVKLRHFAKYKDGGADASTADTVQVKDDSAAGSAGEPSAIVPVISATSTPVKAKKGGKKGRSAKKGDAGQISEKTREASEVFDVTVVTADKGDSRVKIVN